MFSVGWVHRDISVGNLYLYKDPVTEETRGLIGDFEFAKEVERIEGDDKKIVCNFSIFSIPSLTILYFRQ